MKITDDELRAIYRDCQTIPVEEEQETARCLVRCELLQRQVGTLVRLAEVMNEGGDGVLTSVAAALHMGINFGMKIERRRRELEELEKLA